MKEKNLDLTPYDSLVNGGKDRERDVNDGIDRGIGERGLLRMFLKDVEGMQMLAQEEEMSVARRSRVGDEASRNYLVESNLRFVIKVVFQYWSPGLPLMDMISEGCLGLIKAAKTFDPDKGFRFLTYAGNSIVQGVIKAIQDHKRHGHDSLDELIYGNESEMTQGDILESDELQNDETAFYRQVCDLLNRLSARERMVITLRFWQRLTLDEVGLRINLGKERVRQIEVKALRKLRWAIERTMIGHGSHADTVR
ncbi:MAG: sigma-70 family RNA polymerase sigma factor [Candidatus Brocadia sinica]|nr:sigma-70 family RNA polymerase sigma factor [Candidatus Brocadia sinica]